MTSPWLGIISKSLVEQLQKILQILFKKEKNTKSSARGKFAVQVKHTLSPHPQTLHFGNVNEWNKALSTPSMLRVHTTALKWSIFKLLWPFHDLFTENIKVHEAKLRHWRHALLKTNKQTGEPRNTRSFPKYPDRWDLSWCLTNTGERSPCVTHPSHILPCLVYPPSWPKKLQQLHMSHVYLPLERGAVLMIEVTSHNETEGLFFSFFLFLRTLEVSLVLLESLAIPKSV